MWKMQRYEQNAAIRGAIRQRAMPAQSSIDRSLEDKPLGGRKKIVITATITVDRRGNRKRERERERKRKMREKNEREREREMKKTKKRMVRRVINQAHPLVSR